MHLNLDCQESEMGVSKAGDTSDEIWNEWYVPFFKFVNDNNDVVRAITYINDGENIIHSNEELTKRWKKETKQAFWLRGGPDLLDALSD